MKLASLQEVYRHEGPFATVYLDTSGDAEDAAKALDLRWRSARERLSEQGVDDETLRAIGDQLGEHGQETGRRGQVVVAEHGSVLLNDELPRPPTDVADDAYYGPVPQLMPYLRLCGPHIPHVVAVIDHIGAEITTAHPTRKPETITVEGADFPVSKKRAGGEGNERPFHSTVEEQWKHNAALIADEISRQADRSGARAIVLAGDVQQRRLVHERLAEGLMERVVETDAGHRDRKASCSALREKVDHTIDEAVRAKTDEVVQEFEQERGRDGLAVDGWEATLEALRQQQVRALLWVPDVGARAEQIYIGEEPHHLATDDQTVREMGAEQVRAAPADAAVIRALVATSAEFFLVDPERVELTEGVGGILRFR